MEDWNYQVLETFLLTHKKYKQEFPSLTEQQILKLMVDDDSMGNEVTIPDTCMFCFLSPNEAKAKAEEKGYVWQHVCETITTRMKKYGVTDIKSIRTAVYLMQHEDQAGYFRIPYQPTSIDDQNQESEDIQEGNNNQDDESSLDDLSTYKSEDLQSQSSQRKDLQSQSSQRLESNESIGSFDVDPENFQSQERESQESNNLDVESLDRFSFGSSLLSPRVERQSL